MVTFVSADYMWDYPFWKKILFVVDIFLFSLLYFTVGLLFSAWFNDEFIAPLNRNLSNLAIFLQSMAELLMTITAIYFIVHFMGKVPSIIDNPPREHLNFRLRGGDVLLAFSIVSCQLLYLDKLRFLFNEIKDEDVRITEDVVDNFNLCQNGGVAPAGDFFCAV
jgi:hypothetical protein